MFKKALKRIDYIVRKTYWKAILKINMRIDGSMINQLGGML